MKNNPTGAMGVADHLGWNWKSSAGLPVVNIPGCPAQPDNMTEVLLYLALHLAGLAPVPDESRGGGGGGERKEGCKRAGFPSGQFATGTARPRCGRRGARAGSSATCRRGGVDGTVDATTWRICMLARCRLPDNYSRSWTRSGASGPNSRINPGPVCGSSAHNTRRIRHEPEWRKPGNTLARVPGEVRASRVHDGGP